MRQCWLRRNRFRAFVRAVNATRLAIRFHGVNVGAGSITCNYDGLHKHATVIGDGAFIGSDTMLVAPVRVGTEAVTGAGSVITRDVPDGSLALERGEQRSIEGYTERRKRSADND